MLVSDPFQPKDRFAGSSCAVPFHDAQIAEAEICFHAGAIILTALGPDSRPFCQRVSTIVHAFIPG